MSKSTVIDGIKLKIDRLVDDNRRLRAESSKLVAHRDRLKAANSELEQQVARLESRIGVLELREGMGGNTEDDKVARTRVNRLMREVDKCIALLNK